MLCSSDKSSSILPGPSLHLCGTSHLHRHVGDSVSSGCPAPCSHQSQVLPLGQSAACKRRSCWNHPMSRLCKGFRKPHSFAFRWRWNVPVWSWECSAFRALFITVWQRKKALCESLIFLLLENISLLDRICALHRWLWCSSTHPPLGGSSGAELWAEMKAVLLLSLWVPVKSRLFQLVMGHWASLYANLSALGTCWRWPAPL